MVARVAFSTVLLCCGCSCGEPDWVDTGADCHEGFFEAYSDKTVGEARVARYDAMVFDGSLVLSDVFDEFWEAFYAAALEDPLYAGQLPQDPASIDMGQIAVSVRPIECTGGPEDDESECGTDLLMCIPKVEGETPSMCLPVGLAQDTARWCADATFAGQAETVISSDNNIVVILHANDSNFGCYGAEAEDFDEPAPLEYSGQIFLGDLGNCGSIDECEAGIVVEEDLLTDRLDMCRQR